MPDAPDDFEYSNVTEFTANLDSAELAARLYSPMLCARKGQVLFMTDFTKGFGGLQVAADNGNCSTRIVTDYASISGLSAKQVSDQSNPSYTNLRAEIPPIKARYYTIDVGYYLTGTNSFQVHQFETIINGSYNAIRIDHYLSPFALYLYVDDSTYYDITSLAEDDSTFYGMSHISITMDTELRKYHELYLNGVKFDIGDYDLSYFDNGVNNTIDAHVGAANSNSNLTTTYVKWLVLTCRDETE